MSQSSIRLIKTPDVERVISYLRNRFHLLSEAEIIKLALSEMYKKEKDVAEEQDQKVRGQFYHAVEEGGKVGGKILEKTLTENGLKREDLTEQDIYDLVLKPLEHHA